MNSVLFSSQREDWETPQWLFDELNDKYKFELDPCASLENHKCSDYFTKEQDGLKQDWGSRRVFCNPPYGRNLWKWVAKAAESNGLCVLLIPARTDTKWFHKYIYHNFDAKVTFIKGRLKFGNAKHSAPFPSMIIVFRG